MEFNWHQNHVARQSLSKRLAARISSFVGSMTFVYIHIFWFGGWILFAVEPFPYGLLTMIVSLEAIFLSTFVMINANDAADRDRANAEADYQTNLDAKKEIEELQKTLATIETQKLDTILKSLAIFVDYYVEDRPAMHAFFTAQMKRAAKQPRGAIKRK